MDDFIIGKVTKNEQGLVIPIKDLKHLAEHFLRVDHPEYNTIRYAFMRQLDLKGVISATIAKEYLSVAVPDMVDSVSIYAEKLSEYKNPFQALFRISGFTKSAYVEHLLGTAMGYDPLCRGLSSALLEVTFTEPNPRHGVFIYDFKKHLEAYVLKGGKKLYRFTYTVQDVTREELDSLSSPGYTHSGVTFDDQPILYICSSSGGVTFFATPLKGGVWINHFVDYVDTLFSLVSTVLEEMKSKVPV
jgi:hypothetical protein